MLKTPMDPPSRMVCTYVYDINKIYSYTAMYVASYRLDIIIVYGINIFHLAS